MVTYKRYSDKTMYFRIEDEKIFCEKVSNTLKTNFNGELIYNKFYLTPEKNNTEKHQKKLSMLMYTSNIDQFNL